jgi:hypothetical protein
MFSALARRAGIAQCRRHVRFVPMSGHRNSVTFDDGTKKKAPDDAGAFSLLEIES